MTQEIVELVRQATQLAPQVEASALATLGCLGAGLLALVRLLYAKARYGSFLYPLTQVKQDVGSKGKTRDYTPTIRADGSMISYDYRTGEEM